jgi:hypothetical protein
LSASISPHPLADLGGQIWAASVDYFTLFFLRKIAIARTIQLAIAVIQRFMRGGVDLNRGVFFILM